MKLDRPTAEELIALLQTLPPETPVRIEDPDTGWNIHQIHTSYLDGIFSMTGIYIEMGCEDDLPLKVMPLPTVPAQDALTEYGERVREACAGVCEDIQIDAPDDGVNGWSLARAIRAMPLPNPDAKGGE